MSTRRVTAATASLVCRVVSTRWPVSEALQRQLGGLRVADLADEDDVGVLAQDAAQAAGEGQAGALVHLHLRDAGDLHLDRVLEGDDVAVGGADLLDPGVQGVGLAGAGRAGDEDQALRLHQRGVDELELRGGQAGAVQPRDVVGRRQQADDDLLAVQRRQGRDARLDRQAVDGELGAAVLRAAPLGDVEPGDDLDAADGGGGGVARHGHDVAEQPVDAVADAQLAGLRLDVDVGGAGAHGVGEHDVDQPDDRRGLDALDREVLDLLLGAVHALEQGVDVGGVLRQRPGAGEVVAHLAVGGDEHDELGGAGVELDVVERHDVGRVGGGDGEPGAPALAGQHQHAGALGDRARQQPHRLGLGHRAAEVDQRQGQRLGEGLRDLLLGGEPEVDDDRAEPLAGLVRQGWRPAR